MAKKNKKIPEDIKYQVLKMLSQKTEKNFQQTLDEHAVESLEDQLNQMHDGS